MSTLTLAMVQEVYQRCEREISALPKQPMMVIESAYLGKWEQVKFPRTRTKRMRKKWAKDRRNFRWIEDRNVYQTPSGLICSPSVARELRKEMTPSQRSAR